MRTQRLVATVLVALLATVALAQDQPTSRPATKVACVGDSITAGVGVKNRKADSYPAQLGRMLGDGYVVANFGVSGATALAHSNLPYAGRKEFAAARAFGPDVVVVMLGTNDSKHPTPAAVAATTQPGKLVDNWSHKADFKSDYESILDAFKAANPDVKLYVATPVPAYSVRVGGIDPDTIHDEIVPLVREIAKDEGARVIDLHAALAGQPEKFPDTVHPNEAGARAMAEAVYASLSHAATRRTAE